MPRRKLSAAEIDAWLGLANAAKKLRRAQERAERRRSRKAAPTAAKDKETIPTDMTIQLLRRIELKDAGELTGYSILITTTLDMTFLNLFPPREKNESEKDWILRSGRFKLIQPLTHQNHQQNTKTDSALK